jgi:hypothetical protein
MGGRVAIAFATAVFVILISTSTVKPASASLLDDFFADYIKWKEQQSGESSSTSSSSDVGYLSRPTFGMSNSENESVVDGGFRINNQTYSITDNFHTPFELHQVIIGETNTFEAKIYAENKLKVQEFLFGVPEVGKANLAEMGIEVWYDINGEISGVKTIQKSNVVDESTLVATHEKTVCKEDDIEQNCDLTRISVTFLEPLKDSVMAIKAIDYKNRYQITYLNEGISLLGDSLNPMDTKMIASSIKGEGLIKVTQAEKYSDLWVTADGRIFEMNDFGSFKQINYQFERFHDKGNAFTRMHSDFGEIIDYEQQRATKIFNSQKIVSTTPDSFSYDFHIGERITDQMKSDMLAQEQIAKEYLESTKVQARYH